MTRSDRRLSVLHVEVLCVWRCRAVAGAHNVTVRSCRICQLRAACAERVNQLEYGKSNECLNCEVKGSARS